MPSDPISGVQQTRERALSQLVRATGASGAMFTHFRRVEGAGYFASMQTCGEPAFVEAIQSLDAKRVEPYFQGASQADAPRWNRWMAARESSFKHLSQHRRLWKPLGVQSRMGLLVVDDDRRVGGTVWLTFEDPEGAFAAKAAIQSDAPQLCRTLLAAREAERAQEVPAYSGCVWLPNDGAPALSAEAHALLRHRDAQQKVDAVSTPGAHRKTVFAGATLLTATPMQDGTLVWAQPSDEVRAPSYGRLTPTERRVSQYLANGETISGIAAKMGRSTETVRSHVSAIYNSLDIKTRIELAALIEQVPWS